MSVDDVRSRHSEKFNFFPADRNLVSTRFSMHSNNFDFQIKYAVFSYFSAKIDDPQPNDN